MCILLRRDADLSRLVLQVKTFYPAFGDAINRRLYKIPCPPHEKETPYRVSFFHIQQTIDKPPFKV